jgi:hypothetical protein
MWCGSPSLLWAPSVCDVAEQAAAARDLPAVVAGLAAAVEVLAGTVLDAADDDELTRAVADLDRCARRLEGQSLRLLAEAGRRSLPGGLGLGSLGAWLRQQVVSADRGEVAARAAQAETLFGLSELADTVDLARTREAVLAGEVSAKSAAYITQAMERLVPPATPSGLIDEATLADAEEMLVEQARHQPPAAVRAVAERLVATLDPRAGERLARDEDRQAEVRGVTLVRDGTGMYQLRGRLTPLCGTALAAAIDAWSAPRPAADGTPDARTPAMRRHDAVQQLAEKAMSLDGLLPTTHGTAYRVVVTVPAATLATAIGSHPGVDVGQLPDGWPVSTLTAQTLSCDADIVPILVGPDGDPLDVGNTVYLFPDKIRQAIVNRDRRCTFPGCGAPPAWCDIHHLEGFRVGGPTSARNGALLCGRHHRHVHARGLVGRLVDGHVVWRQVGAEQDAPPASAATADRAIDELLRRWLRRNPQLRAPGRGVSGVGGPVRQEPAGTPGGRRRPEGC